MLPAGLPMPLDLETPVVISHSWDGMRYKTDASITQTNPPEFTDWIQTPANSCWAASNLHVSHFRNEGPRKTNSPCLMPDREPVHPQTHSHQTAHSQPESPNSGSWTTLLSLMFLFLHPRETVNSIFVCLEKGMGGWKHTYSGWGCYLFPSTNRSAFMLKWKSNDNEKRHPMGKK